MQKCKEEIHSCLHQEVIKYPLHQQDLCKCVQRTGVFPDFFYTESISESI